MPKNNKRAKQKAYNKKRQVENNDKDNAVKNDDDNLKEEKDFSEQGRCIKIVTEDPKHVLNGRPGVIKKKLADGHYRVMIDKEQDLLIHKSFEFTDIICPNKRVKLGKDAGLIQE